MRWMDLKGYRPPAEYLRRDEPEPEKKEEDFSLLDALSAGVGTAEEHFGALTGMENFANEGRAIKERNLHQYEDNSIPYHLQNIFVALPESAGIMAASTAAGIPLGGALGAAGGFARGALTQVPRVSGLLWDLAKAYQGAGTASKIARAVIPQNAKIATSAELGAAMEAGVEGYEAERRFIDLAKRNGTYVQGQTEQQAREVRDNVFWDNMGIISAFNIPQYNLLMGRPARGLLGNVGRTVASGFGEGTEEVAQELASAYELGVTPQWRDIRDSFIAGGVLGTGMHGAGTAARYGYDRLTGAPTAEEIEEALNARKERLKEYSDRVGRVTVNDDGTAAYDNTPYGDIRQTVRNRANLSEKQAEIWDAAQYASARAKEKYDYDISPELIYKQWAHEAGVNFDSPNAIHNNNFGGLTQTEPNGEENKQPDGNNYYRHFNNVREYADAYVDDFIKYYPEISGTKNEREFASVLKKYGYFGDSVENYAAGMEGISAPTGNSKFGGNIFGVENYAMPTQGDNITQQVSQLKDGWSGVIPQIGGVLKEKFGLNATISSAARSADHNAEVGGAPNSFHIVRDGGGDALDIVFDRDTTQEEQDRIADYFKGTGLFSEVLYHDVGSGAHLHLGGLKTENLSNGVQFDSRTLTRPSETRRTQHSQLPQEETPKPLFDINAEDEQTQKLLERFANERIQSEVNAENPDRGTLGFFTGLFNEAGEFQNTEANRAALRERYGNDITSWANEILKQESPAQPAAPARTQSSTPRQGAPKVTNEDILAAVDNFLERLRTDRTNPNTLLELQEARRAGDVAKMESILRQNNAEIAPVESTAPVAPSPQPPVQPENVVQNNQPPENILTSEQETAQPQQETNPATPKPTKEQKQAQTHINRVSKATNLANKNRNALDNIVNSIQWLAAQNNIVIPAEDLTKLKKRSLKTISKWRDRLTEAGALTVKPVQETTTAPPAPQKTTQQPPVETTTSTTAPLQAALQRARQILDTQRQQEEQAQRQQEEQALRERQAAAEAEVRRKSEESYRRIVQEKAERERQEAQQREDERNADIRAKYYGNQITAPEANEADFRIATAPISTESRAARAEQGRALLRVFYSAPSRDVQLPAGLEQSLERGDTKAIETAQGLLEQRDLADRRRSDTRAGQADEQALIAQEEDIARRAAQSQHATDIAQQGLMQSTAERRQNQREPEPREETREETQENVTRQEQPAQEDDRGVFDLLPEPNELNNVESTERTEQRPPREIPQTAPQQAEPTQETQPKSQSETPAQIEPPKPKAKRSKKAAALHKKFKTDTHPNIGAYLDDLIETAKSTDPVFKYMRQRALNELKQYESMAPPTDEQLARVEAIQGIRAWIEEGRHMPVHEVATAIRNRLISGEISIEQAQQQIEELKKLEPELRNKLNEARKLAREKDGYFSDVGLMMEQEADLRKQFLEQKDDNVAKPDDKPETQSEPKSEAKKKPTEAPAAEEKPAQDSKPQETETQKENSKKLTAREVLKAAGITKPTYGDRWTSQVIAGEKIESPRYDGKWFAFIDNRTDSGARGNHDSNERLLERISGKINKILEITHGTIWNKRNDSFLFDNREDAGTFAKALNIYFGNETQETESKEPSDTQDTSPASKEAMPESKPAEKEADEKQEKRNQLIQKLKDDLAQILDLDNHPNLKEYLYRGIDLELQKLESENLKKLKEWCDSQITEAKGIRDKGKIEEWEERAKERLPKPQPKPQPDTQKTAPAREEPNTESKPKTEPSAQTHKMPKFLEGGTEIKEQDLLDLIDQAWDKGMQAELEEIYNIAKESDFRTRGSAYDDMQAVFEAHQAEENSKTRNGKHPATIDECKSIDDVAAYWRAKYNPRVVFAPELKELNFPAVKEFLKGFEQVFSLFPSIGKKIVRIDAYASSGAIAYYKIGATNVHCILSLNYGIFKTKKDLEQTIRGNLPYKIKNFSATSVGRHESGHMLASALFRRAGYVQPRSSFVDNLILANDSSLLFWASELLSPSKKDRLSRYELDEERKKISKDAYEGDGSETVADAIADVLTNGEKAAPLSKAIIQRIQEALKGDTWREHTVISKPFPEFSRLAHKNINTATVAKWYKARIAEISKTPEIEKAREKYNKHKEHWEKTLEAYLDHLNGQVKAGKISSNEADERYRAKVKTTAEKIAEFAEDFTRISRVHTDYYATEIRKQAEQLLYDRGLAEELAKTKSREEWEALLERRTPDEKILEQDGWTDAKINECAKDTHTANIIEQLGGKIKDGKVTFSNAADKAAFTRFMELMVDPNARYDVEGGKGTINTDTSNVVSEKNLTPAQKSLVSFGKKFGARVIFFDNPDGRFRGVHKEGYSLLNINGNKELGGVFWHESFHWLKNNNPELYKALVKAARITDAQRKAYLETSKRTDLQSNEEIDEEILADMMDAVAKRTGLFQSIAGKNRGLIERVIQWFKDTLNKFIDHFRNPQGKLTTKQAQALADEFGRIANRLKDPNGNQIFRYNRHTHNVELANNREHTEAELSEMTAKNAHFEAKYSVDSNDNSTKSFKQRVKNLLGIEGKNIPIHKQMKRQLEDLSNMKIAADHLPEGVQVKIDKIAKVIRTGREYDWANILPEVGNAVAEQLGITQSAEMGNYIGKFILNGAPNDESAEAKEFAKAMRENTEMRNKVMAIRNTFNEWNNMSAEEQMIASTRYDKEIPPLKERAQKFWQYLRTELFDTQLPIHYHVAKFVKATGIQLADSINPEKAFTNLRGMQERAMRFVYGNEYTREALQKMYPNVDFSNWKPIAMILESIKAEPGSQKYKQFDQFVKACHFLDIHRHNDNVLMQQNKVRGEIRNLRAELDKADTKKKKAELERSIKKKEESLEALKQKIMDTPDAYTKDKCADLVSQYSNEFGEAQKDLVRYSRVLLDIWVDSGMMDRRRYHQLLEAYPNYVPLHREFDENPNLNTADSMKHMLGSTKDVKDAIAAISNNTFDYIQRTEKNKAKLLLANLANFDGVGGIFELLDGSSPNDGTIIHFYENGKRKALQCSDEDIVKAVNSMNQPTMNLFLKVLQVPALMLRATATGLSPGFILGNFLRDPQDAFMISKRYGAANSKELGKDFLNAFNPLVTGKYMLEAMHMGKLYEEYAVSGAAQADFFSFDRDYKAEAIERLTKKNYKRFASPKGVIELLGKLGEWSELSTRLRQYDKVKKSRAKEHGGINIYDDLVTAAFESRDFIDFARHGNAGRTWNTLTAFANPVLQGFDKQWRTYDFGKLKKFGGTEETQKEFYTSVARLFLGGVLPALVLSLLHKDDDWYKDDVQDWEKENYWILSEGLRVPKGADVGLRFFSNLTEHLISSDPVRADKVLQPLKGILPDLMPTAFLPIFECMANYDLFRRQPIVPQREVNKYKDTPELQYDSTNSKLAVLLGRVTGVSPRYIDHVIYGYTSGFGKEATHLIDTVTPGRHGAWTRSDVPFFSRVLRTPYRAPKIVSEYYEEFGRQESYAQRLAWEKKHGNPNAKPSAEYNPALHRRLKNIQRAMQNLNAAERAIMDDPKLTSEQVEEKREEIQKKRVELCRKAFQRAQ